jgi:hypothetical protein
MNAWFLCSRTDLKANEVIGRMGNVDGMRHLKTQEDQLVCRNDTGWKRLREEEVTSSPPDSSASSEPWRWNLQLSMRGPYKAVTHHTDVDTVI